LSFHPSLIIMSDEIICSAPSVLLLGFSFVVERPSRCDLNLAAVAVDLYAVQMVVKRKAKDFIMASRLIKHI
jgi:hypothetical protein